MSFAWWLPLHGKWACHAVDVDHGMAWRARFFEFDCAGVYTQFCN